MGSNPGYVLHINRGLADTKTAKGEFCNIVPDYCIDHYTFESISSIFQAYNLCQQDFQWVASLMTRRPYKYNIIIIRGCTLTISSNSANNFKYTLKDFF